MEANYEYRYNHWLEGHWEPVYVDVEADEFYRGHPGIWRKVGVPWSSIVTSHDSRIRYIDSPATSTEKDNVNSPTHYNESGIECIEAIRAALGPEGFQAYCKGNCMKYLWRYKYKNGIEDLKKAQVYLGWLIETLETNVRKLDDS